MAAMKIVVRLDMLHCDRQKQKAIKTVSTLCGIDEIVVDTKDGKMTVVGTVDPFDVVRKLRKRFCMAEMVSVAPAKEEKKNGNKENDTTDGNKEKTSVGGDKKGGNTKGACTSIPVCQPCYPPHWYPQPCYLVHAEEHPYTCVIC